MELQGDGFKLRTWQLQDATALQEHADNSNVSRYLSDRFPYPYTLEDANFFINLQLEQSPVTNFVIDIDGELAGGISLEMRGDVYSKTPRLGYWLGEKHWNKGIITKATQLICNYGFAELDIICIQAVVFDPNIASMRVLEKAGFIKQGILAKSVVKNGEVFDEYIYALYQI